MHLADDALPDACAALGADEPYAGGLAGICERRRVTLPLPRHVTLPLPLAL